MALVEQDPSAQDPQAPSPGGEPAQFPTAAALALAASGELEAVTAGCRAVVRAQAAPTYGDLAASGATYADVTGTGKSYRRMEEYVARLRELRERRRGLAYARRTRAAGRVAVRRGRRRGAGRPALRAGRRAVARAHGPPGDDPGPSSDDDPPPARPCRVVRRGLTRRSSAPP